MFSNSFRARLMLGAAIWISAGLLGSFFVLSHLFREVVTRQVDHDLSDHTEELFGQLVIDPEGNLRIRRQLSDPRFVAPGGGLYWQVQPGNGELLRSPSLGDQQLPFVAGDEDSPRVRTAETSFGRLRVNQRTVQSKPLSAQPLILTIAVDARQIDAELTQLDRTLALSLGVIALGLSGAAIVQVAVGLWPLARVRRALVAVRTGQAASLPEDLPHEVAPLVSDLNSMIAANNDMLQRARSQAGSLAHALKTPLAILHDEAQQLEMTDQAKAAGVIKQQCEQMQRQIDYQMARARAAGRGTPGATTVVGPAVRAMLSALARLHRHRGITLDYVGPDELTVACDPQDFSEIIGNLADNGAKWARTYVRVSAVRNQSHVLIKVEDDGPGVPEDAMETVFELGKKLDERKPGSGLGLAISREVATLYGGRVWLERSPTGATVACLELPVLRIDA